MKADLHSHTVYSDGVFTVDELLERAIKNNVDVLAITDHDCVEGSKYGWSTNKNIKVIYGLELSTERNNESVHILGYFKEPLLEGSLINLLEKQRKNRKERALKMLELLDVHFNIKLDPSFISNIDSVTRGTIANEIIKQGYPYTKKHIFDYMLGKDCKAYIPASKLTTEYGIKTIHENGGIAVVAHPCLYKNNNIYDIIKLGIDGIEGRYPSKFNDEAMYRRFAINNNLLFTAGSDFHQINDLNHGDVGQCTIDGEDLKKFLEVLYDEC